MTRRVRRSIARRGMLGTVHDLAAAGPLARALPGLLRHGATVSGVIASGARRYGDRVAVVDASGAVGFRELEGMVRREASGIAAGERLGIMCRDGRWLVVAVAAAVRAGADAVLIGQGMGEREVAGVLARERVTVVVRDEVGGLEFERVGGLDTASGPLDQREGRGRLVMLTSGTTGEPTAPERARINPLTVASLLTATGIRRSEPVLVLPPLHHGHGLSLATACLILGAPVIVGAGRSLDELMTLAAGAAVISGVPTQLSRLAAHPDAGSLHPRRIVSGSGRLAPTLAARLRELYGPVLADFFGTTATGTVTIATADDLADAPGTVGRPAAGVRISVLDECGRPCPRGTIGAVHAASRPTGDLGWLDDAGRLFLAGRTDGLTVSGGENVSAAEVEDYLASQPEVTDVHVRAAPDDEFGSVLVARVVLSAGSAALLRARMTRELGKHKVPRVEIVQHIERTPSGKVRLVAGDYRSDL